MMGSGEIMVILVVVLILFGGKRLPEFAHSLGKGIREFKKACYGEEEIVKTEVVMPEKECQPACIADNSSDNHS